VIRPLAGIQILQRLALGLPRIEHRISISQLLRDRLGIVSFSSLRQAGISIVELSRQETFIDPGAVFAGQASQRGRRGAFRGEGIVISGERC
jgi:hypothetical protein